MAHPEIEAAARAIDEHHIAQKLEKIRLYVNLAKAQYRHLNTDCTIFLNLVKGLEYCSEAEAVETCQHIFRALIDENIMTDEFIRETVEICGTPLCHMARARQLALVGKALDNERWLSAQYAALGAVLRLKLTPAEFQPIEADVRRLVTCASGDVSQCAEDVLRSVLAVDR